DVADRRVWTEVVVEALIYHIVRLTMCGSARHVQHTVHASDAFLRYAAQRSYSVLQIHYTASHKILFSEVLSAACLATPFEVRSDVADRRVWTEVVVEALIYHIVRLTMCGSARHVQHTVHASDAFLRYAAQRSYSVLQIHYTASHKILFSEVLSAACLATPFEV